MIFALSIWTLEIDGKPTLAFEAMKYREADEICHQEWLRLELGQRKINDVPLCGADSHLRIQLARPAEMLLYRQAKSGLFDRVGRRRVLPINSRSKVRAAIPPQKKPAGVTPSASSCDCRPGAAPVLPHSEAILPRYS